MSGQQSHRRTIYRPRRRRRPSKPLRKNKRSSLKIHPSNRSIHPNQLPPQHRSRLFWTHLRPRRSASRSQLAANRPHLFSRRHRRRRYHWSSRPPSARSRSQTPHRERNPGAALIFGREIQSRSAPQRSSQKRLYQKLRQNVREKQLHRMHSEKCLKRATTAVRSMAKRRIFLVLLVEYNCRMLQFSIAVSYHGLGSVGLVYHVPCSFK